MNDKRLDVHCGRLTEEEMEVLMRDGSFDVVVDATHPYAQIVSQNVRQAADKESISLIRLRRSTESAEEGFVSFKTHEECSAWLSFQTGNILLTTGSKDLGSYAKNETIKNLPFCACASWRRKHSSMYGKWHYWASDHCNAGTVFCCR